MTFDEYTTAAEQTAIYIGRKHWDGIIYNTLKLNGEAGELADKIGKLYGKAIYPDANQIEELKKELGDVLWHLAMLAQNLGTSLDETAKMNIEKLASRQVRNTIWGVGDNR